LGPDGSGPVSSVVQRCDVLLPAVSGFFGSETHRRPELEFSTVFLSWWNSAANQLIKMQFLIMPHLIDYSFLKTKILKADF
jgi:hypothetical protein